MPLTMRSLGPGRMRRLSIWSPLSTRRSEPSGTEIDWPSIMAEPQRWGRQDAWPLTGVVQIEVAGKAPDGLEEARREIAAVAKDGRPWPAQLVAAAGLSRALATVAVPLSLYDAHTAQTIAPSIC